MTDHLASAKELLSLIDNLQGDELDQVKDLERVATAHALVDIAGSLRRLNDRGDAFTVELLSFFERLTEDPQPGPEGDGSLRSEQPAAAPGCRVCGNLNIETGEECLFGDITRAEWLTHRQHFFETALSFRTEYGAGLYADQRMRLDFGPCPEES